MKSEILVTITFLYIVTDWMEQGRFIREFWWRKVLGISEFSFGARK
jgi:hypothetical protein